MTMGAITIAVMGLIIVGVIGLCGRGVIKRGIGIGIRLPAIQQSDQAWQIGHRAALVPYTVFAVVGVVAALLPLVLPSLTNWSPALTVVAVVAGLIVGGVFGSRAANTAAAKENAARDD